VDSLSGGCSIYNLANGREIKITELVQIIFKTLGKDLDIEYSMSIRDGDPLRWAADISKIRNIGFEPKYTLENGIQQLIRFLSKKQ
jgi:nucleoside-diphosphate-sugar epimerase